MDEKTLASISGLLAVVMACLLKIKSTTFVSKRLSDKFGNCGSPQKSFCLAFNDRSCCRYPLCALNAEVLPFSWLVALLFRSVGVDMPYPDEAHKKNGSSVSFLIFQRLPFGLLLALFLAMGLLADRLSFRCSLGILITAPLVPYWSIALTKLFANQNKK